MTPEQRTDGGVVTQGRSADGVGPLRRWAEEAIYAPGRLYRALFVVAMLFFLLTTLFPFYFLFVLAVAPTGGALQLLPALDAMNLGVFLDVYQKVDFLRYMFNSLTLALVTTIFVLVISSLAGYVFGRLRFPGRQPLMLIILAVSYFPPAAFLVPLYQLFTGNVIAGVNLYNTAGALILPFSALFMPLSIFILTTFYRQIPDGLEDAARIEGTTRLGALFRVIVPLSAPGVATAGVLTFIAVYNEFFFSQLMNNGQPENWAPIVGGLLQLQRAGQFEVTYEVMAAGSIMAVIPVAILVVIAQEKIVSGLTSGALKE
jgi:multiple sugar transport system permease protein